MTPLQPGTSRKHSRPMLRPTFAAFALLAVLAVVIMACGIGAPGPDNTNTSPTATTAPAATTAADATATAVPPTPTHTSPTPTPVPPLQSQIITKSLGTISAGTNSAITNITCPSGYLVAGGGPKSGYTKFTLMQNAPLNTTTWRAEVFNNGAGPINVEIQVVCLKVSGLVSQIITKSLGAIGPNTNSMIADATCPSGYLVAGGGPNSGYTDFTLMWSAPISTTTWRGEIYNRTGSTIYAQMQVVCLKVAGLHSQIITKSLGSINAGTNSTIADSTCPSGYLVAGGGPKSGYPNFTQMWSAPISTTTWRGEVFNIGGSTINVDMQMVCMKR
jgi:hypothetical protein